MRARRLETEDSEDSETQGDESSVESHASPPAKPRPPLMASQSSGVSVVSAVSQWRQRAARAGGCQAAGCVIRVPASESERACQCRVGCEGERSDNTVRHPFRNPESVRVMAVSPRPRM